MRFGLWMLVGCASAGPVGLEPADAPIEITLDSARPVDAAMHPDAAPVTLTLSETQTQDVLTVHSIVCNNGTETAESHWYRVFPLAMFGVTQAFHVQSVAFGVELVAGAAQVATVNVGTYGGTVTTSSSSLSTAQMMPLASANVSLPVNDNPSSAMVNVAADIPAGASVLVEVVTPSGIGANRAAVLGSNETTETLPSFTSSPDVQCGFTTPVSFASLGHPEVHMVITATGSYQP